MEADKSMLFHITGTIDYVHLPLGISGKSVRVRYEVVFGPDWELISGSTSGISQTSSPGARFQQITFDMPLEFIFRSTNPFGWPQLVFNLYGDNFWGAEVSRGNTRIHVPLPLERSSRIFEAPLVIPRPLEFCSKLIAFFTDYDTEFRDVTLLTQAHRVKGIRTESYGSLFVTLQTLSRGSKELGFDW